MSSNDQAISATMSSPRCGDGNGSSAIATTTSRDASCPAALFDMTSSSSSSLVRLPFVDETPQCKSHDANAKVSDEVLVHEDDDGMMEAVAIVSSGALSVTRCAPKSSQKSAPKVRDVGGRKIKIGNDNGLPCNGESEQAMGTELPFSSADSMESETQSDFAGSNSALGSCNKKKKGKKQATNRPVLSSSSSLQDKHNNGRMVIPQAARIGALGKIPRKNKCNQKPLGVALEQHLNERNGIVNITDNVVRLQNHEEKKEPPPNKSEFDDSMVEQRSRVETRPKWHQVSYRVDTTRDLGFTVETTTTCSVVVTRTHAKTQAHELGIPIGSQLCSLNRVPISSTQHLDELWRVAKSKNETATLVVRQPTMIVAAAELGEQQNGTMVAAGGLETRENEYDDMSAETDHQGTKHIAIVAHTRTDGVDDSRSTEPLFSPPGLERDTGKPSGKELAKTKVGTPRPNKIESRIPYSPQSSPLSVSSWSSGFSQYDNGGANIRLLDHDTTSDRDHQEEEDKAHLDSTKEIWSRVYCKWTNGQSYWGTIVRKYKKNPRSKEMYYSVQFEDGDFLEKVRGEDITTEQFYKKVYQEGGVLTPAELYEYRCKQCLLCKKEDCLRCATCVRNQSSNGGPHEVCLQKMCCDIKESRKAQPAVGFPPGWTFVFGLSKGGLKGTADSAISKLSLVTPKGRVYNSVETAKYSLNQFANTDAMVREFHAHVGLSCNHSEQTTGRVTSKNGQSETLGGSLSLQELYRRRCKKCVLCLKADCGKCAACKANQRHPRGERQVCLQKMCCLFLESEKLQPAPGFPSGWAFAIEEPRGKGSKTSVLDGLIIISPSGRRYRSVKAAKGHQKIMLKHFPRLADIFHKQLGVIDSDLDVGTESTSQPLSSDVSGTRNSMAVGSSVYCAWPNGYWCPSTITKKYEQGRSYYFSVESHDGHQMHNVSPQRIMSVESYLGGTGRGEKRKRQSSTSGPIDSTENATSRKAYTPRELYKRRCKNCTLCRKPACGRCATCLLNHNREEAGGRVVCLRKMCCAITAESKAQKAVGFPSGWRFMFDEPDLNSIQRLGKENPLLGLVLLAPKGRRYRSVESAINCNKIAVGRHEDVSKEFYVHVGAIRYKKGPERELVGADRDLVGKGILQEWTDIEGRNKIVYGTVAGCTIEGEDAVVSVEYSDDSRLDANFVPSVCGTRVPKSRKICYELALGGCALFEEKLHGGREMQGWTWKIPECRHEELLDAGYGVTLPRLAITFRGFRLVFTVKESSVPGAGYGVFVKATALVKNINGGNNFELEAGELLDLGVYAPLRVQDRKKECVVFVKKYIHSFKGEEFSFNTDVEGFEFDITEDVTADVHELARRHIPSYVNGCRADVIPTVRAESDPEGNVHFLLGVVDGEKLCISGDGAEKELFVNTGQKPGAVRVRKGCSELPYELQAQKLSELEQHEEAYLEAIGSYDLDKVGACVEFFRSLLMQDGGEVDIEAAKLFGSKAGERALRVAKVFEKAVATRQQSGEQVPLALVQSVKSLVCLLNRLFGR